MGRGDKKTKKGKISMGSYGNSRPREDNKSSKATSTTAAEKPAAKPAAKDKKK
jgi:30S ribosomal protein S31